MLQNYDCTNKSDQQFLTLKKTHVSVQPMRLRQPNWHIFTVKVLCLDVAGITMETSTYTFISPQNCAEVECFIGCLPLLVFSSHTWYSTCQSL